MTSPPVPDDEARRLVNEDPDFVNIRRFNYSIDEVVRRYPDGAPIRVIAQALMIDEADVAALWSSIVEKLRVSMGVES